MGLFLRFALLALICVQFFSSPCFARVEVSEKKSDLEKALDGLRETLGDESAIEEIALPEDTSPRFLVKQVRISGNSLVRTSELFCDLPVV